jgi:hypothetical protein
MLHICGVSKTFGEWYRTICKFVTLLNTAALSTEAIYDTTYFSESEWRNSEDKFHI